ncbi:MAG: efflux RND transporter periplasmic adaptor subunit, partial [Acidobacteriaceae bacterium]|nr:efflux RND transporter periplasmic adaptor subunit [Acidobacteriaceae bacterium]
PGQHFSHDTQFYEIADLKRVWVVAEVFQQDEPYLRPGALAEITVRADGRRLQAHIADSLPQSEAVAGTVKLRLEVDNPKLLLRPDMVVDVNLPVHVPRTLAVPNDAVINAGTHARVYVEHGNGIFEPREVETGWRTEDSVEILKGLAPGERVVVASTFLVDSESRLKSLQPVAGADAASSSEASEQTMAARP